LNLSESSYFKRVLLVPSAVFLSAIFGGAYGSGRAVVEFASRHGPIGGLLSLATIALVFIACLFVCFEVARLCGAYDFHAFGRVLLKRASVLYEAAVIVGLTLTLAINATTSGTLIADHFGYPPATAVVVFLVFVVALTFFGRTVVEAWLALSFVALIAVLAYMSGVVAAENRNEIGAVFSTAPLGFSGVGGGLQVALTDSALLPLLLFCSRGLQTRAEVAVAALVASLAAIAPAAVLHLSFMLEYPEIIEIELPAYRLIGDIAPTILNVYVAVLFLQMMDTGVAVLWGLLESLRGMSLPPRLKPVSGPSRAAVSAVAVIVALLLSSIGLIDLLVRSYVVLFAAFLLVFYVPLLTRGVSLVLRRRPSS
jgi:uncharacterized membrane protein YkvI